VQLEDGSKVSDRDRERAVSVKIDTQPIEPDTRPPIERFRRPPKKALSVTDIISPSWCELQYFYTLSKHGRKKRTPAMKQGTKVHQALEDEVHRTVPVMITKKEDSWGLRLWNIIQGLRTLRDTGRTRELEIWGNVGGELVNGVIDELSYDCPDPKLEEDTAQLGAKGAPVGGSALPEYQTSITDYLLATGGRKDGGQSLASAMMQESPQRTPPKEKRIYITDVKTRAHPTLPAGASIRPTILQLHLYHHMLENLAQGNFALIQLAERYQLDVNETFSDSFIAQIGGLNQEFFDTASSQEDAPPNSITASQIASSQDSIDVLLKHNNLGSLWDFMMSQFRQTFLLPINTDEPPTPTPQSTSDLDPPAALPTRLSPLLTAEYLAPTYKHIAGTAKKSIGSKSFNFNSGFLRSYLEENLAWWRGDRPAKGVELQEAWKCRSCDFRDDCEWIHERDAAALAEAKERKKVRDVAGVDGKSKNASRGTWEV
jgi:exonuclease V